MQTFMVITFWVSLLLILLSLIIMTLDMCTDVMVSWNDKTVLAIVLIGWGLGGFGLLVASAFLSQGSCSVSYSGSGYYMPVQVGSMSVPMFVPN